MNHPPKYDHLGHLGHLGIVPLSVVLAADLGSPSRRRNGDTSRPWWCCPFHPDSNPSFTIYIKDNITRFTCYGCNVWGNVFDYLRLRDISLSGLGIDPHNYEIPTWSTCPQIRGGTIPPRSWRQMAAAIIHRARRELQSIRGRSARRYLYARGLSRESTRLLGYDRNKIVIPTYHESKLVAIRYRKLKGFPKYFMHTGSGVGFLFPCDTLSPTQPLVLTEGELDALLLLQEAGDLVQVGTLGSATAPISPSAKSELLFVPRILVAGDNDDAGQRFADRICDTFRHAEQVILPSEKDLTDYHLAGHNLRRWVRKCLANV